MSDAFDIVPAGRAYILSRLRAGKRIHMEVVEGRRLWWFDGPREPVDGAAVERLISQGRLVGVGDNLLGDAGLSQSWELGPAPKRRRG